MSLEHRPAYERQGLTLEGTQSRIAPYHDAPRANIAPPDSCAVVAAAFLIRHSSIYANDDEWEEYMSPFADRVKEAQKSGDLTFPDGSPLAFLADWSCPINDDNLEKVTGPGIEDAYQLGKRFRELYGQLMPPKNLGKKGHRHHGGGRGRGDKDRKKRKDRSTRARRRERRDAKAMRMKKPKVPFKVWSASSGRDVDTSKAWVRGAFPHWQEGKDGEGDSQVVKLVAVPNKVGLSLYLGGKPCKKVRGLTLVVNRTRTGPTRSRRTRSATRSRRKPASPRRKRGSTVMDRRSSNG